MFYMLERLHQQRAAVVAVISDSSITSARKAVELEITQQEWKVIEDLIDVLRPFQVATSTFSEEAQVTASSVLPVIVSLVEKFLKSDIRDVEFVAQFKELVRQDLTRRFDIGMDSLGQSALCVASFLDPRFKNLQFLPENLRVDVHTLISSMLPRDASSATAKKKYSPSALDFLLGETTEEEDVLPSSAVEIQKYMLEQPVDRNDNPLAWWHNNESRFPLLALVANKYLSIPSTSSPSERVFSTSGNIVTHKRSVLSPDSVKYLVFLNYNLRKRVDQQSLVVSNK